METLFIPTEQDFRRWIKEALIEYFEGNPLKAVSTAEPSEENFLNRKQVAGIFGISLVTLHDWMNKGLPSHKQGGRVYFLRSEVFEHVKENKRVAFEGRHRGQLVKMSEYLKAG